MCILVPLCVIIVSNCKVTQKYLIYTQTHEKILSSTRIIINLHVLFHEQLMCYLWQFVFFSEERYKKSTCHDMPFTTLTPPHLLAMEQLPVLNSHFHLYFLQKYTLLFSSLHIFTYRISNLPFSTFICFVFALYSLCKWIQSEHRANIERRKEGATPVESKR